MPETRVSQITTFLERHILRRKTYYVCQCHRVIAEFTKKEGEIHMFDICPSCDNVIPVELIRNDYLHWFGGYRGVAETTPLNMTFKTGSELSELQDDSYDTLLEETSEKTQTQTVDSTSSAKKGEETRPRTCP